MDAEEIKEIVKSINIKGEINSETVEKVSKDLIPQVMPYFWVKQVLSRIESVFWGFIILSIAGVIAKGCTAAIRSGVSLP